MMGAGIVQSVTGSESKQQPCCISLSARCTAAAVLHATAAARVPRDDPVPAPLSRRRAAKQGMDLVCHVLTGRRRRSRARFHSSRSDDSWRDGLRIT